MMPLTVRFIVVFLSLSFFCFNDGVCCLDHVEYEVGDCNVIITASHGGSLTPSEIPNRISGCWDAQDEECVYEGDSTCADDAKCGVKTFRDSNTKDLAEKIAAKYLELSGKTPHLIISNLKRSKLDANREIGEAAQGDPIAEAAYNQFHGFIQDARAAIAGAGQRGVLFDIHGHVHAHGYTELGYLLYKSKLIASNYDMPRSSVRKLASDWESQVSGQELIAGNSSLGEFMQNLGYDAVPSFTKPAPSSDDSFFSGGYITKQYGSRYDVNSPTDAVQLEFHKDQRHDDNRDQLAEAVGIAIFNFTQTYYT